MSAVCRNLYRIVDSGCPDTTSSFKLLFFAYRLRTVVIGKHLQERDGRDPWSSRGGADSCLAPGAERLAAGIHAASRDLERPACNAGPLRWSHGAVDRPAGGLPLLGGAPGSRPSRRFSFTSGRAVFGLARQASDSEPSHLRPSPGRIAQVLRAPGCWSACRRSHCGP